MPVKILVADDSVTMRSIMQMTFAGEDAEVVSVDSGQSCVEQAQRVKPDVVFADVSMAPMDGYDVAKAIKSNPGTSNIAVIVLTSQHNAFDEPRGKSSGVDDHVAKPFDSQVAIDKVGEVLSRPRASVPGGASAAAPAAPARPPTAPQKPPRTPTVAFGTNPRPGTPAAPAARPKAPGPAGRPVLELADDPTPAPRP
ncbi:MAG: response regulator, partial [Myxococcota bacterium]